MESSGEGPKAVLETLLTALDTLDEGARFEVLASCLTESSARIHPDQIDDDSLIAMLEPLHRLRGALDAAELKIVANIDLHGSTVNWSGLGTAAHLAHSRRQRRSTANGCVSRARTANRFTAFATALGHGQISLDHLRVLGSVTNHRNLAHLIEIETALLTLAGYYTFTEWEREVRSIAALLDADGAEPREPLPDRLRVTQLHNSTVHVDGVFNSIDGTSLRQMLQRHVERTFERLIEQRRSRAGTSDPIECDRICGPLPSHSEMAATALVDLVRAGHAAISSNNHTRLPETDLTVVSTPHPDAEMLNDLGLAGRYQEQLFVNMFGIRLDPFTLQSRITPAAIMRVLVDRQGNPTHLTKRRRYATTEQRKALIARGGHSCAFPGCERIIEFGHAHHITPFSEGGPTHLPNLVMLCPSHRRLTHSAGWSLKVRANGHLEWHSPNGATLVAVPQHHRPPPQRQAG